jgi:hypothetical protein
MVQLSSIYVKRRLYIQNTSLRTNLLLKFCFPSCTTPLALSELANTHINIETYILDINKYYVTRASSAEQCINKV